MKDIPYLGLDVDSEKIAVAVAEPGSEVRSLGAIPHRDSRLPRTATEGPAKRASTSWSRKQERAVNRDRRRLLTSARRRR